MKLLSSIKKEMILATRSFYFYIELLMAAIMLVVLLTAIPEHASAMQTEYLYIDLPPVSAAVIENALLGEDADGKSESVSLEAGGKTYQAELYESPESEMYLMESEAAVEAIAKQNQVIGIVVEPGTGMMPQFKYYLQGYESQRLKNLITVLPSLGSTDIMAAMDSQEVVTLSGSYEPLNDRQNMLPPFIVFSGSLMGMFIMAAYIFLDREEGVIKAYAVSASSVSHYLLSKISVLLLTTVITGLIITVPVMGGGINYALLILLLLATGFFASMIGLLIGTFFGNMTKSFGLVFTLLIVLMLPSIAYFIPGWDPVWMRFIVSDPMLRGFKEILLKSGDVVYPLIASAGFLAAGGVLLVLTRMRFARTLAR